MATKRTHNEMMVEDGFELTRSRKRVLNGKKVITALDYDSVGSSVTEEKVRLSIKNAHEQIDNYLKNQMQNVISTLHHLIGNERSIKTIRAIGLGNFYSHGSDSSLQISVLERLHSEFKTPPLFYQEPRCLEGERSYLINKKFQVLPADSLQTIPPKIVKQMETTKDINLIFMIHFDHFGFEYLLNSFEALNLEKSLVFIGNSVPIDYKGELPMKLAEKFTCQPMSLPAKPATSSTQKDKCLLWWRKAFSNTSIYIHK